MCVFPSLPVPLFMLILNNVLQIASGTSASIALPSIGRDFGVPEDNLQWVVSAFSLSSVRPRYTF